MWKDPIVEEIHAIRVAIEEECQGDFAKLSALAYETEQQYPDRIVTYPAAWESPVGWTTGFLLPTTADGSERSMPFS